MSADEFIERKIGDSGLLNTVRGVANSIFQNRVEQEAAGLRESSGVGGVDNRGPGGSFIRNDGVGTFRTINDNVDQVLSNTEGLLSGVNDVSRMQGAIADGMYNANTRILGGQSSIQDEMKRNFQAIANDNAGLNRMQGAIADGMYNAGNRILGGQSSIQDEMRRSFQTAANDNAGVERTARYGFQRIADVVGAVGGDIQDVVRIMDTNLDNSISNAEIAQASRDKNMLNELSKISPLITKAIVDPNFRIRAIKKKPIVPSNSRRLTNQKNVVRQGYAGYLEDLNEFNTDFK